MAFHAAKIVSLVRHNERLMLLSVQKPAGFVYRPGQFVRLGIALCDHPQTEEHYFAFIAFVCDCGTMKIRCFKPTEEVKFCLDEKKHGKLYWFCNLHGLYEMEV